MELNVITIRQNRWARVTCPSAWLRHVLLVSFWLLAGVLCRGELLVERVSDLNPGYMGSYPKDLKVFNGTLFFSATTKAVGRELWKYDGQQIALVSNINDAVSTDLEGNVIGADSSPGEFAEFNGSLFFSAYDARRGAELWRTDGANCHRAADINPDADDLPKTDPASSWPKELTVVGAEIFFPANNSISKENFELWKFDGATASLATNIHPNSGSSHSSYPSGLTELNGFLFFSANDGANGYELWKHDGTRALLLSINPGSSHAYPKHFTTFENALYFQAQHSTYGTELWKTDGTTVSLVTNLAPGTAGSYPEEMAVFSGALYFRATGPSGGSELWRFDGATTTLAAEVNPTGDAYPKSLTVCGNRLYFAADDGVHGWELWACDGTNAWLVSDLNPSGDSFPEKLTAFGGALYFAATTPETGYELWRCDGANITLAADINPGSAPSYPENLTVYGNRLCFSATEDGISNWELWSLIEEIQPPTLTGSWQGENGFSLQLSGEPLRSYTIEVSTNLTEWTTNTVKSTDANGQLNHIDEGAIGQPARFYRAR